MKQITNFITEGLRINKNIVLGIKNEININELKYFSKEDVEKIINWINNDMPKDIRPTVIVNDRKNVSWLDPELEIYLLYDDDYEKRGIFDIPYIRFYYDATEGLSAHIYDAKSKKYYNSALYKSSKDLDKCFDYIIRHHKVIKEII